MSFKVTVWTLLNTRRSITKILIILRVIFSDFLKIQFQFLSAKFCYQSCCEFDGSISAPREREISQISILRDVVFQKNLFGFGKFWYSVLFVQSIKFKVLELFKINGNIRSIKHSWRGLLLQFKKNFENGL